MTTITNVLERCASPSPLAGARHASAERRRSSEEDVTKGYKTLFETVNPLIEGLNARVGTVEARLTAQESKGREEVTGLMTRITQLEQQNQRLQTQLTHVESLAQSALSKANSHTHKVKLETRTYFWGNEHDRARENNFVDAIFIQKGSDCHSEILKSDIESAKPT